MYDASIKPTGCTIYTLQHMLIIVYHVHYTSDTSYTHHNIHALQDVYITSHTHDIITTYCHTIKPDSHCVVCSSNHKWITLYSHYCITPYDTMTHIPISQLHNIHRTIPVSRWPHMRMMSYSHCISWLHQTKITAHSITSLIGQCDGYHVIGISCNWHMASCVCRIDIHVL